ncbi:hypothetical protein AAG570_006666 [Ranatra chinensis]|uniref:RecA family profile 1 domain-containing protein n=1 Tax=Ranatra chinensis TaxID=642074 RepID=A0ABD0ZFX9_9HEMI
MVFFSHINISFQDLIYKEETALQLLSRLRPRPSLLYLEPRLFPEGLKPYEVVEIYGEHSTGKTLLLMQLIKTAILPTSYNDVALRGLDADVILLNTDHHFNISKLGLLMKKYIKKCFNQDKSIENLIIFNCFESESLHMSFHVIKKLLCENVRISLIFIDSICAFYWLDTIKGGIRKMDLYVINTIRSLSTCINSFKVSVIFTRPKFFQTAFNPSASLSSVFDLKSINVSIHLDKRIHHEDSFQAEVRKAASAHTVYYTINDEGINWL